MLNKNILIKITGSIAAYKTAYLISKLVQSGFKVKTVVTQSALQFIGKATLEGLTDSTVYSDTFESNKMMSHINLVKWADLTIVVPADANTISKFANGIADNLVTSLFLAHDFGKPYLIAPAMNTKMFTHPATQKSIKQLNDWGIEILPTVSGHLACGDEGIGKLWEPDKIYDSIVSELARKNTNRKNILITGGGTIEYIDGVRYITNLSSGKTAQEIADHLFETGNEVTLLKSETAVNPVHKVNIVNFTSFQSLKNKLKTMLETNDYDAVVHLAAVSDYSPSAIEQNGSEIKPGMRNKLSSNADELKIKLLKNEKLINKIKQWSAKSDTILIAFKFTGAQFQENKKNVVEKLFDSSEADYVVYNSLKDRDKNIQKNFEVIEKNGKSISVNSQVELAEQINKISTEGK